MKLLTVVSSMNPSQGGVAQGIRNYMPYWEQYGIENTIITTDCPDETFVKKDNIIALGPIRNRWGQSDKLKSWLYEHLSEYDVVIVNGLWLYNNYILRKVHTSLKKSSKPVPRLFVMPHGMLDPYFQKSKKRILKAIRNVFYWHLIEKKLIKAADGILFTCNEEMALAATTFSDYNPQNTYNVGFGINNPPPFLKRKQFAFEAQLPDVSHNNAEFSKSPYLLFMGRIHPKKGIDLIIDAYKIIINEFWSQSKQLPNLVIAGPVEDISYSQKLVLKVESDAILQSKIFFCGMLEGDAKWGALYGCEAFILPSHQENFGIAIVEAMACKKAVLISNKVNIWYEIQLGKAGFVENDNLEGTIQLLTKWIGPNQDEKHVMCDNAFNTYTSKFKIEDVSARIVDVLTGNAQNSNLLDLSLAKIGNKKSYINKSALSEIYKN